MSRDSSHWLSATGSLVPELRWLCFLWPFPSVPRWLLMLQLSCPCPGQEEWGMGVVKGPSSRVSPLTNSLGAIATIFFLYDNSHTHCKGSAEMWFCSQIHSRPQWFKISVREQEGGYIMGRYPVIYTTGFFGFCFLSEGIMHAGFKARVTTSHTHRQVSLNACRLQAERQ